MFDIFCVGKNDITKVLPGVKQVNGEYEIRSLTKMHWVIEPNVNVTDLNIFDFRPEDHDSQFTHMWKWNNNNYGGVKLVPKKASQGVKEHDKVVCEKSFDVLTTDTPEEYFEAHPYATHVWVADPEYILPKKITWAPDNFEPGFTHVFHIPGQLEHKYPKEEGGIKLYPRDHPLQASLKYHGYLDVSIDFPVIRTCDPNNYDVNHHSNYVWLVDSELDIHDSELNWIPDDFQREMVHNFHIPGQLEFKYPQAQGPVSLVPVGVVDPEIVYHGDLPFQYKMIRVNDNTDYNQATHMTEKFVWLVDHRLEIDVSELQWIPDLYQRNMVHNFHVPGQLEHEYPEAHGPVSLIPVGVKNPDIVFHGELSVHYQVLKVKDPTDFSQRDHIQAEYVWLVDERYSTNSDDLKFLPSVYDRHMVHNFHLKHQLEHIYPEEMGGVYLVPKNWKDAVLKIMGVIDGVRYPVVYTKYPEAYEQRDYFEDEYVWLVDEEHKINEDSLTWTPSVFEDDQVHNFRMHNQLRHKYPQEMGGIYLVPKDHANADLKIHLTCPVEDEIYDVYRVDHTELTADKFSEIAKTASTEWFWVIDADYEFNGKLRYVPADHESEYIHVFKWGMEHRYLPEVTELWDNRVAGIYLVNKNFNWDQKKLHTKTVPIEYDIFYVDNINDFANYSRYSRQSRTEAFWLVDNEHRLPDRINWIPARSEQCYINIFKLHGQLEHKYPRAVTNTSDNRCGGIKLVPRSFDPSQVKFQGNLLNVEFEKFGKFSSVEEGLAESKTEWFWVVDDDVEVAEDFDWEFVPDPWDAGKTHVWQIANPVTGLNYDYGGVRLCHKHPTGGRDKYIKITGSTRNDLDVLYLDSKTDILEQLNKFESGTYMYYVIDPHVKLSADFNFDVYPTQWDSDCVHLFKNSDGSFKNVRLVPKGYQFVSLDQITNNSYEKLKEHDIVASINREWPVYHLDKLDAREFHAIRNKVTEPWFFTVDPGTTPQSDVWDYEPDVNDFDRVHVWQRLNPHTNQVHGYGGIRLWPTDHTDNITTDALIYNRIPRLRYVRQPRSVLEPYPVILLSYLEERAQTAFDALTSRSDNVLWVKDVKGIFNAHKEAAKLAGDSKMFWVVDADAELADDFDFNYMPDVYDQDTVHVWTTINPVTGSKYGYGGVKLFNTSQVRDATSWGLDFTTGLGKKFKAMPEVCGVTKFNTSAYDTWRSAFRECVKLTVSTDTDAEYRLTEWLNPDETADFHTEAKLGAEQGKAFALANSDNLSELDKINDYEWLQKKFSER